MKLLNSGLFIIVLILIINTEESNSWNIGLNKFINNCWSSLNNTNAKKYEFFDGLRVCLQKRALIFMDAFFSDDVIHIYNGIDLVKLNKTNNDNDDEDNDKDTQINKSTARESNGKSWKEIVFGRFAKVFQSHVFKINLDRLTNRIASYPSTSDGIVEGRRRHHRRKQNQMMSIVMMGALLMGSVLIPMGFQFLAVLGGKALILAKLALMLSSIQGLKRVATSGINYGLYHSPDGWHERSHIEPPIIQNQYELVSPYPYLRS